METIKSVRLVSWLSVELEKTQKLNTYQNSSEIINVAIPTNVVSELISALDDLVAQQLKGDK